MSQLTSPEISPAAPPASPPSSPPAGRPENSDSPVNPVTVALVIAGVVAFSLWRPTLAKQIGVFLLTLGVLVAVHEWGHYQFARWAGMKVNRFGIGFPPWVYTRRRNGIDYSIGALPIGGMVDIAGLGSEEEMVASTKGEAVANPTRGRNPKAPFGQKQFQDAGLGWRFWTLFAGPLMNFLFALVVFVATFSIIGEPVRETVTPVVDSVAPGMAASAAGLQAKDKIVAVNGQPTGTAEAIVKIVRANQDKPLRVTVERGGQRLEKTVTPRIDELTNPVTGKVEKVPLIGVEFFSRVDEYRRVGVVEAAQRGMTGAIGMTKQIFGLLGRVATGGLTQEDKRNVGGPVKIAQVAGRAAERGMFDTLLFMGGLSVNLGLLNLLPFPALDGGRILFLGYELVMRRPLDPRKEGLVHAVGMVMLLAFMLFITLRDVVPLFPGLR